jgi:hypothetical protein
VNVLVRVCTRMAVKVRSPESSIATPVTSHQRRVPYRKWEGRQEVLAAVGGWLEGRQTARLAEYFEDRRRRPYALPSVWQIMRLVGEWPDVLRACGWVGPLSAPTERSAGHVRFVPSASITPWPSLGSSGARLPRCSASALYLPIASILALTTCSPNGGTARQTDVQR